MIRAVTSIEQIEERNNVVNGYGIAYGMYLNEIRAQLSQHFLSLDEGLKRSLDQVKFQVAEVLKTSERRDYRGRTIVNSIAWVGEETDESVLRAIAVRALKSFLKEDSDSLNKEIDEAVKPCSKEGFKVDNIVTIKENLEILFADIADVFVAGNLFWYPVEGNNNIRLAPDAMVVFGRPKGKRGSYQQWKENNIPPQVVFEILSPSNRNKEMANKLLFYQRYGVEEYYIYDPEKLEFTGLLRSGENLEVIEEINGWVSPRLGVQFQITPDTLEIYRPDGRRFLTSVELDQLREQERQDKGVALLQLEQERQRYQDLLARLQERGIDPENL